MAKSKKSKPLSKQAAQNIITSSKFIDFTQSEIDQAKSKLEEPIEDKDQLSDDDLDGMGHAIEFDISPITPDEAEKLEVDFMHLVDAEISSSYQLEVEDVEILRRYWNIHRNLNPWKSSESKM